MLVTVAAITGSNYTSYGSYALMLVGAAACIWVPLSFLPRLGGRKVFAEICFVVGVAAAIAKVTTGFGPNLSSAAPPSPAAPEPASVVITPVPHPTTAPAASDASDDLPIGKPQETPSAKPADAKPLVMKPASSNAPAAKPAPDRDLGDVYTDHANGYSIRFPAAWTSTQFTGGDPWFIEVSDGKTGLVSVGFSPFPASAGLEQLKPASLAAHLQGQRQTTVEAQGYGTISGQKCLWFKYTGPVKSATGEQPMTVIHYYLPLHDGRMFELRLAALPDAFPKVASVFKKSAATVKLVPM
jgi:hypothetical protein